MNQKTFRRNFIETNSEKSLSPQVRNSTNKHLFSLKSDFL